MKGDSVMKRITKLLALALSLVMLVGCITIASASDRKDTRLSLVQFDTSSYSYKNYGRRVFRIIPNCTDTVDTVIENAPIPDAEELDIVFVEPRESMVSPFIYPERTAEKTFLLGVVFNGSIIGELALTAYGVWSQVDGYGRVVGVGYDFYNCLYDEDLYSIVPIYTADSKAEVYIFYGDLLAGAVELEQHTNGNITCEMLP